MKTRFFHAVKDSLKCRWTQLLTISCKIHQKTSCRRIRTSPAKSAFKVNRLSSTNESANRLQSMKGTQRMTAGRTMMLTWTKKVRMQLLPSKIKRERRGKLRAQASRNLKLRSSRSGSSTTSSTHICVKMIKLCLPSKLVSLRSRSPAGSLIIVSENIRR